MLGATLPTTSAWPLHPCTHDFAQPHHENLLRGLPHHPGATCCSAAHTSWPPYPTPTANSRAAAASDETKGQAALRLTSGAWRRAPSALPQEKAQEAPVQSRQASQCLRSYVVACPKGPYNLSQSRKPLQKGSRVSTAPGFAICDPNELISTLTPSREKIFPRGMGLVQTGL